MQWVSQTIQKGKQFQLQILLICRTINYLILELLSTDCSSPLLMQVDEELRVEEVEIYYDPGEFLAGLIKGPLLSSTGEVESHATSTVTATNPTQNTCPFTRSSE